jgi:hypothetical protein
MYVKVHQNTSLAGHELEVVETRSLLECVVLCRLNDACASVNFSSESCTFNVVNALEQTTTTSDGGVYAGLGAC